MDPLRYAYLTEAHFPALFRTFMEAFADYSIDMSYMKEHHLFNRWRKNGVSYESSVGAFDGDRMVGFMAVGLDDWKDEPAAFDAGTGIVRGYRGFGVAPAIFDLAFRGLRQKGVRRFVLEVIQTNRPAVGTYKKLGFKIGREFDCFQLALERARLDVPLAQDGLTLETISKDLLPLFGSFTDWAPSWETSFASIQRIPDPLTMYGARFEDRWVGFAAYYPGLNWIMNVVVERDHRRRGVATRILNRLVKDLPSDQTTVKLLNVDHSDGAMLSLLSKIGFEVYTRQYEMELDL